MKTEKIKESIKDVFIAVTIGVINGVFGSGGGMITVPFLTKKGSDQKDAQRNAIAVILPLSIISAGLYITKGKLKISDALPYLPGGIAGAVAGTALMSKISPKLLKCIFGGFMFYAGIRLLIR